jgi:hypothetical protein
MKNISKIRKRLISEKIFSKLPSEFEMEEYYQTFSDKLDF